MRLVREAQRMECENQRQSRRSQFKRWLEKSHPARREAASVTTDLPISEKLQAAGEASSRLPVAANCGCHQREQKSVSPLAPSLKKTPSALSLKWSAYIEAMGLKQDAGVGDKERRVRFPACDEELGQEFERPEPTPEEKASCHYSTEELGEMVEVAKELLHRESRFAGQPKDTILEQGFLTMPANTPFFQTRRYYCLLRGHRMYMYTSPTHAAKNTGLKAQFIILRVQDCQSLSSQKKVALFGASFPAELGRMFYVIKANGERVVLTADDKSSKRNWVYSLTRLTYVGEGDCSSYTKTPPLRSRSASAPMTTNEVVAPTAPSAAAACARLGQIEEAKEEEETEEHVKVFDLNDLSGERRHSCSVAC